jgi:hypothetical protein
MALAGGCSEPAAGELRTDRDGLAERMHIPTGTSDIRWMARGVPARRGAAASRADARVFAWLAVSPAAHDDLVQTLGDPLPSGVAWMPADVATTLVSDGQLRTLAFNERKKSYRLEGERFRPMEMGMRDYHGTTVVLTADHVYVALAAR